MSRQTKPPSFRSVLTPELLHAAARDGHALLGEWRYREPPRPRHKIDDLFRSGGRCCRLLYLDAGDPSGGRILFEWDPPPRASDVTAWWHTLAATVYATLPPRRHFPRGGLIVASIERDPPDDPDVPLSDARETWTLDVEPLPTTLVGSWDIGRARNRCDVLSSYWLASAGGPRVLARWAVAPTPEDRASAEWKRLADRVGSVLPQTTGHQPLPYERPLFEATGDPQVWTLEWGQYEPHGPDG